MLVSSSMNWVCSFSMASHSCASRVEILVDRIAFDKSFCFFWICCLINSIYFTNFGSHWAAESTSIFSPRLISWLCCFSICSVQSLICWLNFSTCSHRSDLTLPIYFCLSLPRFSTSMLKLFASVVFTFWKTSRYNFFEFLRITQTWLNWSYCFSF